MVKIINFLLIAGVLQGLCFNLITVFVKKKFNKVIIFLNLTVLFISLSNLQAWLIDNGYSSNLFLIKHLEVPWYLLIFPVFYSFTTNFLRVEKRVNDFLKPSLIIFIFELIFRLCLISYVYYNVPNKEASLIEKYTNIEEICNLFYCLFLFFNASILVFRKHEMLDYILAYDDLKWIKWFIRLGTIVIGFWAFAVTIDTLYGNDDAYMFLRLSSSMLLYWIGYQGFYKYNVVQDRIFLRSSIVNNNVLISSSTNTSFGDLSNVDKIYNVKHQKEFENTKDYIIKNKLYLDPLLSMETVTSQLNISKSHFSKIINEYGNCNFSDFINSLRVAQAKKFLSNNDFSAYTIVAIGLECGFNSKSTFYSAFKKFTSQTPTTFRDQF
ncbi:AraC-type DNA-binding protein [Flaviramulus basaltis]|uniref:AraC-type DNA-binding protein n=1 Tax=Flaviramulus basaltis TaxID=369401 RepID=A0A1K2IMS9_9FLAO|nr:helix-turn-helix transcriptional regulator [Flaviramulus basaltis]SFZ93679.1 AraC-type DNA-binding protein [Flaviramulus basaltis]